MRGSEGQGRRRLCGFRQRHRPHAARDQAPVPPVLAGQCLDRLALRRRRARTVVGETDRPRDGRRYRGGAAARRRDHLHADGDVDPRQGFESGGFGRGRSPAGVRARALRVLSVEDNPFGRVVLNAILTELGHQAEFIGRGEAAAERIAQGGFDAVLMDMVLPGIDGIEAIRRIRALGPAVRRASRSSGYRAAATTRRPRARAGADAFLVKPVSPRALATALLEATRRAAAAT